MTHSLLADLPRPPSKNQPATELTFTPTSGNIFSAGPLGEYAQAKFRCWMNLLLILLASVACRMQPELEWRLVGYTSLATAGSALTLLIWAKLIVDRPAKDTLRLAQRVVSIIIDNVSISWILYFGDHILAGAFALYLQVTIGYGVRYGPSYLYASLSASVAGFIVVAVTSHFWRSYPALAIGLGVGLLILPLYAGYLVTMLYNALARAEAGARAKADFVAKMSHELRTPLHGVIALTELLGGDISETQRAEMTRLISTSSNTLLDLINRILDISKYESGSFALQIEDMDLHGVLAETIDLLLPQASAKGLALSLYLDPRLQHQLKGSPRQIQEVIVNLAGNAIKFTDTGAVRIQLTLPKVPRSFDSLTISIVDTGPGMESDYLTRMFDPFSQADDSVTRQHGGTGLGTTIARDLIELMSGELRIRSAPGVGTRVDVELQLPWQASTGELHLANLPELAVLVGFGADTSGISAILEKFPSIEVREFGIGELHRQIQTLTTRACFFVKSDIADTVMPMLREDLARRGRQAIPIVFGYGTDDERQAAIDSGVTGFISNSSPDSEIRRALHLAGALFPATDSPLQPEAHSGFLGLILIAEDNSTNQIIARMTLERAGYRCHIVADGERALDELQTGAYDLALMDMHMPLMDGLDVARMYNFIAATDPLRTPIVMVTADNRPDLVADADLVGIARFAIKPLRPSQLLATVQELMSRRQDALAQADQIPAPQLDEEPDVEPDIDEPLFAELMEYMNFEEAELFFGEFVEDAERYIATVRQARDGGVGATRMRDHMHALCGSARTVGAKRLAAISRRIEYASESDERYNCRTFADELDEVLERTMKEVRRRLIERESLATAETSTGTPGSALGSTPQG